MLAGVLIAGFVISLPFWISSSPEQKQQMAQTATAKIIIEKSTGSLDIKQEEKEELREMLKPVNTEKPKNFEHEIWVKDIQQLIGKWVPNDSEAEAIARWVHLYSVRFDLSPELVLGIIAVESQFDHFALSNVGARGLMQVMPFWKQELGSDKDNLFEIETNLRYGCAIIRHYLNRYKKLDRALAAYNGSLGSNRYPNKVFTQMRRFKATREDTAMTKG
ncbi:MAG TPA: lytic transglycosylase domain-containing protein [Mariprofundaceae bacterium]|nr:lytic transglycosylase domain-containing protein [Mariprofundaceae bacterium]